MTILLGLATLVGSTWSQAADDNKAIAGKPEPRVVAGKNTTATGLLLQREAGKAWQAVKQGADVFTTDMLVGFPGAAIDSKNGAVRLTFLSDLEGASPFPVLESAVSLHSAADADFDFVLDRGRVELVNRKDKGTAKVKVHFRKAIWELTLEPGSRVGLELYGRWPRGIFFNKDDKTPEEPTAELVLIVLNGGVELKAGNRQLALQAPPGPAFFHWDSVAGADQAAQRLAKLPEWADPEAKPSPMAKERTARLDKLRQRLVATSPEMAVADLLKSKDPAERRLGVISLGALDNLSALIDALNDPQQADVRDNAVMALRHWIGRGPGQDLQVYALLTKDKKYPPAHADIVLRLLHSFGEADLGRPETYEALIAYLNHDKLPVRELARWQLYRLVAGAKDIPYDAAAPVKDREAAVSAWKKKIPEGKLPEKAKPEK
jgi:hypothetical protein